MTKINYSPAVAERLESFKEELRALEFELNRLYSLAPVGFIGQVIELMTERIGNLPCELNLEKEQAHFLPTELERLAGDLDLMARTLSFYIPEVYPKTEPAFAALAASLAEKGTRAGHLSDTLLDHEF